SPLPSRLPSSSLSARSLVHVRMCVPRPLLNRSSPFTPPPTSLSFPHFPPVSSFRPLFFFCRPPPTHPLSVSLFLVTHGVWDQVCRSRGGRPMEIQPSSVPERKSLAGEYLGMYGKKLTDGQMNHIVNAQQCQSALFLRTLLEELRDRPLPPSSQSLSP